MATLPVLDLSLWDDPGAGRQHFEAALLKAAQSNGFFYLQSHGVPIELMDEVLDDANRLFDLPEAEKMAIHIRQSAHFRGYSVMKNARDWREQIHFGPECPPVTGRDFHQLLGPNLCPSALGVAFERCILTYMAAIQALGDRLLQVFAALLDMPATTLMHPSGTLPYQLMKMICYYPQPMIQPERPGVAAHCDWSWFTILLQDEVGGLEVLTADGVWVAAPPLKGAFSVNLGELMEVVSNGRFVATAHRVVNPSEQKRRVSVPVFINPALEQTITKLADDASSPQQSFREHIHRVLPPGNYPHRIHFGESEWRRKGCGQWCYETDCLG